MDGLDSLTTPVPSVHAYAMRRVDAAALKRAHRLIAEGQSALQDAVGELEDLENSLREFEARQDS